MRFPIRTVLCATDLSPTGDGAVGLAFALAAPGATVHLLHVDEPAFVLSPLDGTVLYATPPTAAEQVSTDEAAANHMKSLVPEKAAARGVSTRTHVVHDAGPAAVILREALRLEADLVVLGTHGRGAVAKAMLGSVATSVMRRGKVPVVLFHDVPTG
jgi:nucleotide-binding universal stress UspA family protein